MRPPLAIVIISLNCYEFIKTTDFNPVHYYHIREENIRLREEKRIRDERLAIVGREWDKSREGRRATKGIPDELQGRDRQDRIVWEGGVNQQDGSSLCSLPREVRDIIWKEIMGGYLIHFIWLNAYRRFDIFRCKGVNGKCIGPACQEIKKGKGVKDHWGNVELLGHLLVCRKMYEEMLPLLYGKNYFQFIHISNRCRNVKVWAKDDIAYDAGKRKIGRRITLKPARLGTQDTTGLRKYAMHVGLKIQRQKPENKSWSVLNSRKSFQELDSISMYISRLRVYLGNS
ncbi:uncharacterized protein Bfra_002232 [Botrytis fragariae]|uniref:DUF7730 domain-containing protein n=1 Tax=Botrytis fragariae TaxID=1964551 RepID=A0A8H6EKR1_9HELO|nr:uncharacterized protein Bfra_002232 [Botrytis fragariae]KAF5875836.1 hypothetical protein Bfra_002232 [Botrytis fragariae]